MSSIVGFTGTRDGLTSRQLSGVVEWFWDRERGTLKHGDCVGADASAHVVAQYHGWRIEIHPGNSSKLRAFCTGAAKIYPAKSNLARNSDIVESATELLACPKGPEELRSGTWSTIRKAKRRGMPYTIIWPDGTITTQDTTHDH